MKVFNQYERRVLEARNGVVEEATEKYLSEVAKKNPVGVSRYKEENSLKNEKRIPIEAEVGQLEIDTFEIKKGSKKVFSTKRDVFPETGPREHHKTVCFRELALFYPCDEPFRKSAGKTQSCIATERRARGESAHDGESRGAGRGADLPHILRKRQRVS